MALALPLRRPVADADPADARLAIIDIGSNSIRLVVYERLARSPAILFNEKVMAGLGRNLSKTGLLDEQAMERAEEALARFVFLVDQMGVARLRTVATAAVREAVNGGDFLARLARIGLDIEVLTGEEEAEAAAAGVLAGIPEADGIVGDLGGGSLELVRVTPEGAGQRLSLPLGVLRLPVLREKRRALDKVLRQALAGFATTPARPFYLVGGSWRALARLDMAMANYPLPIVHQYVMAPDSAQRLVRVVARIGAKRLAEIPWLSSSRIATLPDAAALLAALVRRLQPGSLVVSALGLREGLLHLDLPPPMRAADPLICAAQDEGARQGRFPEHGDLLEAWMRPLFASESAGDRRLRHAACLLADTGWRAHPDYRAERGLDIGMRSNWVGIDARGRAMLGHALFVSFGGGAPLDWLLTICGPDDLALAARWGLALRLGQRLAGGTAQAIAHGHLGRTATTLPLYLGAGDQVLYGEAVERRHKTLAAAFGLKPELIAL